MRGAVYGPRWEAVAAVGARGHASRLAFGADARRSLDHLPVAALVRADALLLAGVAQFPDCALDAAGDPARSLGQIHMLSSDCSRSRRRMAASVFSGVFSRVFSRVPAFTGVLAFAGSPKVTTTAPSRTAITGGASPRSRISRAIFDVPRPRPR